MQEEKVDGYVRADFRDELENDISVLVACPASRSVADPLARIYGDVGVKIFTLQELAAHNEKIAREAWEASQIATYKPISEHPVFKPAPNFAQYMTFEDWWKKRGKG